MKIKVSDYIARFIAQLGVKHVFIISGGGNMHLLDSIAANKDLTYVATHHEQSAAMAAEAYSRVTDNIGVCCVTFGPAATNTLTGVAGAWLDSIPVLYISGQVKRTHMATGTLRQLGVQEIDIISMVKPITKYAVVVREPLAIRVELERAVHLATHGRPGPVYLDIPADVQATIVDEELLEPALIASSFGVFPHEVEVAETISLIRRAKRAVLFVGHGIILAKARNQLSELIERLGIPVVTSMSAHDLIATDHPLFVGRPGVFGDRAGNLAVQNCDLLISIGVRHCLWNIGYDTKAFAKHATKVVVDIDVSELGKNTYIPDLAIQSDAKLFIEELLSQLPAQWPPLTIYSSPPPHLTWRTECQRWKTTYPVALSKYITQTEYVNSYHFTDVLSSLLSDDEVIFTGVGTSFTGTLQSIKLRANQRFHCNVGCASMGYDLPAAIGAAFASGKRIVLLTGDGSIMMNLQELATIAYHKLPIKIFLFNNQGYLAIKNTQRAYFGGRLNAVNKETGIGFPNFGLVADTFDIDYMFVNNHDNLEGNIHHALECEGPIICELNMDPNQPLLPKVCTDSMPDGTIVARGLEDMEPLLSREEFNHNMRHIK